MKPIKEICIDPNIIKQIKEIIAITKTTNTIANAEPNFDDRLKEILDRVVAASYVPDRVTKKECLKLIKAEIAEVMPLKFEHTRLGREYTYGYNTALQEVSKALGLKENEK